MSEVDHIDDKGNIYFKAATGTERRHLMRSTSLLLRYASHPLFTSEDFNNFVVNMAALIGYEYESSGMISSSHEPHEARREHLGLHDQKNDAYFRFHSYIDQGEVDIYLPTDREILTFSPMQDPLLTRHLWIPNYSVRYHSYTLDRSRKHTVQGRHEIITETITPVMLQKTCRNIFNHYKRQSTATNPEKID